MILIIRLLLHVPSPRQRRLLRNLGKYAQRYVQSWLQDLLQGDECRFVPMTQVRQIRIPAST